MRLWILSDYVSRQFEDKNLRNEEYEKAVNRMVATYTRKQSVMMILKGILFAILLTVLEYSLKSFEITGFLRLLFRIGFFSSLVGVAYVPYGIYNLIKNI